ncbi:MAG: hypothetical protein CBC71_01150 [Rhodobacteraceae bacterium TMED111]|nr:MAG: hypothetical protein CBC71_01150 [Rhodobacteraceae bacterium TMED111]|tara:strand:- start:26480 stop:26713 length:234 start_codon:yes stop_codon:yes gene_type:complete
MKMLLYNNAMNKLQEYIKNRGKENVATICDVSVHAVNSWYYGTRQPTVKQAKKIMLVTNKALNWEDIYGPIEEEAEA